MKEKLQHMLPPGFTLALEASLFWGGEALVLAVFFPTAFYHLRCAVSALYAVDQPTPTLLPGAMLPDVWTLLHGAFYGLFIVLLCLPLLTAIHYLSYRRGSMSIYLMRRLPSPWLLHQQCWTLPLIALVLYLLTAALLFALFFLCYLHSAPISCLPLPYRRFL